MGFFSSLFKKKKQDEWNSDNVFESNSFTNTPLSWSDRFRNFGSLELEEQIELGKEFLTDLGRHFENPRLKDTMSSDQVEIRGRISNHPIRLNWEVDTSIVEYELKCNINIKDHVFLHWDLDAKPVAESDDDDWGDNDEMRVFIGKGLYIEGSPKVVNSGCNTFYSLPLELRKKIIETSNNLELVGYSIGSQDIGVSFYTQVHDMRDPELSFSHTAQVMAQIADALKCEPSETTDSATPNPDTQLASTPLKLANCSYCAAKFNIAGTPNCPNCGGTYTG